MAQNDIEFVSEILYIDRDLIYSSADGETSQYSFYPETCVTVLCYSIKIRSNMSHDLITRLNNFFKNFERGESGGVYEKFIDLIKDSFAPQAKELFKVPKVEELILPDDQVLVPPKRNEILAGFMDFLLQVLITEAGNHGQWHAALQKEMTFLLTFLGDVPFQCADDLEDVEDLLTQFEIVANEAACFIYSIAFGILDKEESTCRAQKLALLEQVELLKALIKEHCHKFQELIPICKTPPRSTDAVDSILIVDTLLADLENVRYGRFDDHLAIDDHIIIIKDQIKVVHEELISLRALHRVHGTSTDDEVKQYFLQIRDAAYESEYLINLYVVGNVPSWYLSLRLPAIIHKFKVIRRRLEEAKEVFDTKVLKVTEYCIEGVPFQRDQPFARVDNLVVGFEDIRVKLLDDLIGGSEELKTISMVGMPGLGKTTVTNKLYDDQSVSDHFDRRAWCVVSQTYQVKNVLVGILMSIGRKMEEDEMLNMKVEDLGLKIYQSLKGQRYLIVFDDVWSSDIWDDLKRYFPNEVNGSRIILTTRLNNTAQPNNIFRTIPLLSEVHCWDLLVNKVFDQQPCPSNLLNIGKSIAGKCNGLPLAVIVVAGILRGLDKEESSWKEVLRNLDSYLMDDEGKCMRILELSYEHLPKHLKLCFLYLGVFPEDAIIPAQKLTWLWVAEGFIRTEGEESSEDVAQQYLVDLINRSLLQIASIRSDGGIKGCRMHDLLRDMCLRRAEENNFLKSLKDHSSIYEKHYRLSHHSTLKGTWKHFGLHCRSIIFYVREPSGWFPQMGLIRVMDLLPIKYLYHRTRNLDRLVHLRYLVVNNMPGPEIARLVNLEVLCAVIAHFGIPGVLSKMVKLRHLHVKEKAEFAEDWDDTCPNTNLKSFSYINISNRREEYILRCLTGLRKLKCKCSAYEFPDFRSFIQLESLKIKVVNRRYYRVQPENIHFPSTIKKLTLTRTRLSWEEMPIVGKLPNLRVLKLMENSFEGDKWETRDGEFRELRFLKLMMLDICEWITESIHFPKLEYLVVHGCLKLHEIPSEIGDIPTLKMIEVIDCSDEVQESVTRIGEEQLDYGNEELKVIVRKTLVLE